MADNDSAQERTEEATPRRLQKAREEGQIPRSKELATCAVLLVGIIVLGAAGDGLATALAAIVRSGLDIEREAMFDPAAMLNRLGAAMLTALRVLILPFAALAVAAIVGPIALGGFNWSSKALAPKLDRISPLAGLKRIWSMRSLVELVKAILKIVLISFIAWLALRHYLDGLLRLPRMAPEAAMVLATNTALWAAIIICAATIFIAAVDVPYQIFDHAKKLKMSLQEIKDEMKESEGKPEVKGRIRQLQRQYAQRQMLAEVPKADIVITNPTHFAVALRYNPATMATPILVAKGRDEVALKIREIAKAHKVDQLNAPALARAIHHSTKIDQPIPEGLYVAVAQVLAYVFQLRAWRKGNGQRPDVPKSLPIPPDLYRPPE